MKNKILVSLIFIIPLALYFILLAINPDKTDLSVNAKESAMPEIIVFSTPMCSECRKMIPIVEQAKDTYKDKVIISKIDASERNPVTQDLVTKYQIYVVPTIIYLDKNGNKVSRTEGSMPYEVFEQYIKKLL